MDDARRDSAKGGARGTAGSATKEPLQANDLRRASFCADFEPELLEFLARESAREHYAKGQQIIGHDSPGKDVFLLLTGRARVSVVSGGGREVTYDVIESGETIGELAAIDGKKRSASVRAMNTVALIRIPRNTFISCMRSHSSFAFAVARRLARTVRWMSIRVQEFQGYNLTGRVCAELLRQCGGRTDKPFAITILDMASRVGGTRPHVSRIITKLIKMGLIIRKGDEIMVLDVAGLRKLMEESLLE